MLLILTFNSLNNPGGKKLHNILNTNVFNIDNKKNVMSS